MAVFPRFELGRVFPSWVPVCPGPGETPCSFVLVRLQVRPRARFSSRAWQAESHEMKERLLPRTLARFIRVYVKLLARLDTFRIHKTKCSWGSTANGPWHQLCFEFLAWCERLRHLESLAKFDRRDRRVRDQPTGRYMEG